MRMLVILAAYAALVAAVWIQCEKTRGENFVAYAKVHGNDPHLVFSHPYKPKEVPMHTCSARHLAVRSKRASSPRAISDTFT